MYGRLGDGHRAELAGGELPEHDEPASPELRHHVVVERRPEPAESPRAEARERAADELQVLDADRDAVERERAVARGIFAARVGECGAAKDLHEGTQGAVVLLDSPKVEARELFGRNI